MKILVIGANGFVGRNVADFLSKTHDVHRAARNDNEGFLKVDLLDKSTIMSVIAQVQPDVIINNAGVVENSDKAAQNVIFTKNLIEVAAESNQSFQKIIISGSAAVYGHVAEKNIPVKETAPLNANAGYGLSKLEEEKLALELGLRHNLPIYVARIFNPIGAGMHEKFLVPKIISQVNDFKLGKIHSIEVSRLDSKRDYINIEDVATGFKSILENNLSQLVYNIGSGEATSNGQLIELIIDKINLPSRPKVIETSPEPEKLVAIQADISLLSQETDWHPVNTIEDSIEEIISGSRK